MIELFVSYHFANDTENGFGYASVSVKEEPRSWDDLQNLTWQVANTNEKLSGGEMSIINWKVLNNDKN